MERTLAPSSSPQPLPVYYIYTLISQAFQMKLLRLLEGHHGKSEEGSLVESGSWKGTPSRRGGQHQSDNGSEAAGRQKASCCPSGSGCSLVLAISI